MLVNIELDVFYLLSSIAPDTSDITDTFGEEINEAVKGN